MDIFYVDDDPDDQEVFTEAIRIIDSTLNIALFSSCRSVEQHLEQTRGTPPSFIFIDVGMPRTDGYECARVIRGFSEVKIILCSTSFSPIRQQNFNLSGVEYMVKSDSLPDFCNSLRAILSKT